MIREWKDVNDELPPYSDRYWAFIKDINDLGISYYQDNVFYDKEENKWSSVIINKDGGTVTHWTELLDRPKTRLDKINKIMNVE